MKISIYSTPTCPWCVLAKKYFESNKIVFENFNVSEDQEKAKEMVEISGQMGVPVITMEKEGTNDVKVIVGFDQAQIEKILKEK
jgi:glutaredoxin-like YruB-family protein